MYKNAEVHKKGCTDSSAKKETFLLNCNLEIANFDKIVIWRLQIFYYICGKIKTCIYVEIP